MKFKLTEHAKDALNKRNIRIDWVERAVSSPLRVEADVMDPALEHCLAVIPEHGNRVLRVIVNV
ncbi:MAG: DUF4258 domain-containing protein [Alphaproteobacteria bacterium]|nr:DUF4258 domain-containing protein [Alphaproteobacteria bacterium]